MRMHGKYILDSNVIIDLFRGDQDTISRIRAIKEVAVPAIVLGELYFGANKSNQTLKRTKEIQHLEELVHVLNVTNKTAQINGRIKDQLRIKGTPIPENDIWIAAIVKEHQLPLVTKDRHFESVDGITVEKL